MVYVLTGCFILMDLVTGLVGALKNGEFQSSIMREGLYHKVGQVLVITFFTLIDYASKHLELGINVPIVTVGCAYICLMEIGQIIENLGKINPDLTLDFINKILKK